jgi:hypothetical protein
MDTLHARADWESVGDRWFRKTQQYTAVFDQDLDLDNYIVTGAPYAGALGKSFEIQMIHHTRVCMGLAGLPRFFGSHDNSP